MCQHSARLLLLTCHGTVLCHAVLPHPPPPQVCGHESTVAVLLDAGADIAIDRNGRSLAVQAAERYAATAAPSESRRHQRTGTTGASGTAANAVTDVSVAGGAEASVAGVSGGGSSGTSGGGAAGRSRQQGLGMLTVSVALVLSYYHAIMLCSLVTE
jgi:hypothetical protein